MPLFWRPALLRVKHRVGANAALRLAHRPARQATRAACAAILALLPPAAIAAAATTAASGQEVSAHINQRYASTVDVCADGEPLHACSGAFVRMTGTVVARPAQLERDAVSFSFLRADTGIRTLFDEERLAGIVMALPSTSRPGPVPSCIYIKNALTDSRPDACGAQPEDEDPEGFSAPCALQGVQTLADWRAYLASLPNQSITCALAPDVAGMAMAVRARALLRESIRELWNEAVMRAWPDATLPDVPFEAVFHVTNSQAPSPRLLAKARALQQEILERTGRQVPILRLDLHNGGEAPFSWHAADAAPGDDGLP